MADTPARLANTGHAVDVQPFARLAVTWHLTDCDRAAVLALSSDEYAQWLTGDIDADVATVVGVRLGQLLAIDLAAPAFYGPDTEIAAGVPTRSADRKRRMAGMMLVTAELPASRAPSAALAASRVPR